MAIGDRSRSGSAWLVLLAACLTSTAVTPLCFVSCSLACQSWLPRRPPIVGRSGFRHGWPLTRSPTRNTEDGDSHGGGGGGVLNEGDAEANSRDGDDCDERWDVTDD